MGWKLYEITENKVEEMSGLVEDALLCLGDLMGCIEKMKRGGGSTHERDDEREYSQRYGGMSERLGGGSHYRDGYSEGGNMSERIRNMVHERRGVRGTGPYSRY